MPAAEAREAQGGFFTRVKRTVEKVLEIDEASKVKTREAEAVRKASILRISQGGEIAEEDRENYRKYRLDIATNMASIRNPFHDTGLSEMAARAISMEINSLRNLTPEELDQKVREWAEGKAKEL